MAGAPVARGLFSRLKTVRAWLLSQRTLVPGASTVRFTGTVPNYTTTHQNVKCGHSLVALYQITENTDLKPSVDRDVRMDFFSVLVFGTTVKSNTASLVQDDACAWFGESNLVTTALSMISLID